MTYAPPRAPGDGRAVLSRGERIALGGLSVVALLPALWGADLALAAVLGMPRAGHLAGMVELARLAGAVGLAAGIGLILYANAHATRVRARPISVAYEAGAAGTMFGSAWVISSF